MKFRRTNEVNQRTASWLAILTILLRVSTTSDLPLETISQIKKSPTLTKMESPPPTKTLVEAPKPTFSEDLAEYFSTQGYCAGQMAFSKVQKYTGTESWLDHVRAIVGKSEDLTNLVSFLHFLQNSNLIVGDTWEKTPAKQSSEDALDQLALSYPDNGYVDFFKAIYILKTQGYSSEVRNLFESAAQKPRFENLHRSVSEAIMKKATSSINGFTWGVGVLASSPVPNYFEIAQILKSQIPNEDKETIYKISKRFMNSAFENNGHGSEVHWMPIEYAFGSSLVSFLTDETYPKFTELQGYQKDREEFDHLIQAINSPKSDDYCDGGTIDEAFYHYARTRTF